MRGRSWENRPGEKGLLRNTGFPQKTAEENASGADLFPLPITLWRVIRFTDKQRDLRGSFVPDEAETAAGLPSGNVDNGGADAAGHPGCPPGIRTTSPGEEA